MSNAFDQHDNNPLLSEWTAPHGLPPFAALEPAHFAPAFEVAFARHRDEIEEIATNPSTPTFANTIDMLERAGRLLSRVASTFFNLTSAHTSPELQAVEREIAPKLSRHASTIQLDPRIFARIDALWQDRDALAMTEEQARVLEKYWKGAVRAGAALDAADRKRMAESAERLAVLTTTFTQNVLADEAAFTLPLEAEDDLAGLPTFLREAAAEEARVREVDALGVVTLARSSIDPFLQFSSRRDLRENAFTGWTKRGACGGKTDNREVIAEIVALRHERARLLGDPNFAVMKLDTAMAKTPAAVKELLQTVWEPARKRALAEQEALQREAADAGLNDDIAPWDWRYLSERVRQRTYDLDEATLKPYFQLDQMIDAAFETATRLFGITFAPVDGLSLYHPDVRAWSVTTATGEPVGLFLGDYFARPTKRSGAWMSGFRQQEALDGAVTPIIVNVMNFVKPPAGAPALLSYDDATTLFHEFGHALHGLLSNVTYPSVSGTSVTRDFVELPSQLFEHWLMAPQIISRFAIHAETCEPIPTELLEKVRAARNFNQGFATVEYLASAILDIRLHERGADDLDPVAFEEEILSEIGMPRAITPRHRLPHFLHLFAGDGYAAGYYSYLWSEVMDADAFRAFEEAGDLFDKPTATKLHRHIYSAGGSRDPEVLYAAFRGRAPDVEALLEGRGLLEDAA
ncbi:MAG: M3 family metallopeptidase [Pseudomonadota bacterium]